MDEELLKLLRLQLGLAVDASEAIVKAKLQEQLPILAKAKTDLDTATTELTNLKTKYPEGTTILTADDKVKLTTYPTLKTVSDSAMTSLQGETLKLYHLAMGGADKADAAVTKLIAEASYDTLKALYKQYDTMVETSHKLTCNTCKGTDISRASSTGAAMGIQPTEGGNTGGGAAPKVTRTTAEVLAELNKPKNLSSGIHGVIKKETQTQK